VMPTCRSRELLCSDRRAYVGVAEVVAGEQQGVVFARGQGIAEAVTDVESCRTSRPPAEIAVDLTRR